ncbi:MAG: LptF/LptG family permease [Rhodospirillaceae bacterium]|nr:LptF/LptG family permease [Rhodospirillaceae bacterium]
MIRPGRIDTYVGGLIMVPFGVTLIITMMLFLLDQMLRLFDYVLVQNGPVELVWRMLSQLVPQYLSHGISLGVFVGILLAFRRLSLNAELDALASGGVSMRRLLAPAYAITAVAMVANFVIIAYLQPLGFYRYQELRHEATVDALRARIKVGEFLTLGNGATLRVGAVFDGGRELADIFIERCGPSGRCRAATAERGALEFTADRRSLVVRLERGRVVDLGPPGRTAHGLDTVEFDTYAFDVDVPELAEFRRRGADQREATIDELFDALSRDMSSEASAESTIDPDRVDRYRAHFHWRILHTLSFAAIPLVAVGFAVANRRAPSAAGPVGGIVALIGYNETLEVSERWVAASGVSPWLAMWPVFAAFAMAGMAWFRHRAEQPRRDRTGPLVGLIGLLPGRRAPALQP